MSVVGLFAGIGGIELGLEAAGYETSLLCEIEPGAQAVLRARFPGVPIEDDITELEKLPAGTEVVTAGFPCQDLSQAGRLAGIGGERSGLVDHVFRLIDDAGEPPRWLVLENVPFMLQLDKGEAMRVLTRRLVESGYRWAYRVVDARSFGVPQRRRRVLLVASQTEDPRSVLFGEDAGPPPETSHEGKACGFYWTEGRTGLGWCVDAVPTIKGGSGLGIPSPPAIWMPDGRIVTPEIRDGERLQGFEPGWTEPAVTDAGMKPGHRWKLVGNAVCVPMAAWLGSRLGEAQTDPPPQGAERLTGSHRWPDAAAGDSDGVWSVPSGAFPLGGQAQPLADFLRHPPLPLSSRAATGFTNRLFDSSLRRPAAFDEALLQHLKTVAA